MALPGGGDSRSKPAAGTHTCAHASSRPTPNFRVFLLIPPLAAVLLLVNVVGASVWYYERKHAIMDMRRRSSVAPAPLGAGEHGAAGVGSKGAVGGPNAARKV